MHKGAQKKPPEPVAAPTGQRKTAVRFLLVFLGLMVAYYGFAETALFDQGLLCCLQWNAWISNGLLDLLGQGTEVTATSIHSAEFAINVRRGCDAFEPAWFFCAAVLAFPGSPRKKALGILIGSVAIFATNLARITTLYLIGRHYPRFFNAAHLEVWPVLIILLAVLMWLAWIAWARPPRLHEGA